MENPWRKVFSKLKPGEASPIEASVSLSPIPTVFEDGDIEYSTADQLALANRLRDFRLEMLGVDPTTAKHWVLPDQDIA